MQGIYLKNEGETYDSSARNYGNRGAKMKSEPLLIN